MTFVKVWSLVPPELGLRGLPNETVAGSWTEPDSNPDSPVGFRENPSFIKLMHRVIASVGPADPELCAAAERQQTGFLYVIDRRTSDGPQGDVPPVDIVGGFEVNQGVIVPGSYEANPNHRLMTEDGKFQLPVQLQRAVVDEVIRLAREQG